ncbi:MAG: Nramp family divalent metal transporter [Bacteroidales bacterium]|nr:Nramp family divalent metal transporter [Bacteroidales bacterium]MCF8387648.1 Nramp family divalent metal transporter [Bacteroidales bacterium]MCF8399656.1 Nramp family divalent metal transporter [Bacteroidales bacterium]
MRFRKFLKSLGPGLLYAGAAVGVSHLVQSTRAGATYGFELVYVLIIANLIKYPFFEFGPRYAIATGNSLISGYERMGKWAVILFALLTVSTMFAIQAAITMVTAGLIANIFNISINIIFLCGIILFVTTIVLLVGRYRVLDKIIKFIILTLALSTIVAVLFAFNVDMEIKPDAINHFNWHHAVDIAFLIAFIGWMPAPIDVAVWHSLWSVAKNKELHGSATMGEALLDFKIGYIGTALLALGFLTLGALVMHGTGEELSGVGTIFAGQLIDLYTISLGDAFYWIIAIAAITTMFSTTITVLDAYPRVLRPTTEILFPRYRHKRHESSWLMLFWIFILVAGTMILLGMLSSTMRFMVDLATTLSFLTAPVFAIMNYKVITGKHIPSEAKPRKWLRIYAIIGIVFLCLFTAIYIGWRIYQL